MLIIAPVRQSDKFGSGAYNAPRGSRKHKGLDFACYPGSLVVSLSSGVVTKIGYPYKGDFNLRHIEITDPGGLLLRYLYVSPLVDEGDMVTAWQTILGSAQSLQYRYSGITGHVHFDIKKNGEYINPNDYYLRRLEERKNAF